MTYKYKSQQCPLHANNTIHTALLRDGLSLKAFQRNGKECAGYYIYSASFASEVSVHVDPAYIGGGEATIFIGDRFIDQVRLDRLDRNIDWSKAADAFAALFGKAKLHLAVAAAKEFMA